MTVRRLDDNGDISTSGQQFINEKAEVSQTISTRLRLFRGEYFRDVTEGTPWFSSILGKNNNLSESDSIIRRVISQTDGVNQITSYNADFDLTTRQYKIDVSVLTIYGEVSLTTEGI